ncbi:MAG: hypothetical protein DRO04_01205 [Candidatus Iainarchaeum archaeon]|uniref:Uncharacterized protein n=1 Tax=Candidatus Iainarchaeum sp. TaxID=3101447 RepID=A0A497JHQ4_9ARCH|nr:MAG: hypothetical protein DRO04_01205 [Candidatus Diapherotrites archaeon]
MAKVVMKYKLIGKELQLPKLVGAFIIVIALLMFFKSGAEMIDSWDNIKFVNNCLSMAEGNDVMFKECQDQALKALNIYVRPGQYSLNTKQFLMSIATPIAWLMFWIVVLALGIASYRHGTFEFPVETTVEEKKKVRKRKKA